MKTLPLLLGQDVKKVRALLEGDEPKVDMEEEWDITIINTYRDELTLSKIIIEAMVKQVEIEKLDDVPV